MALRQFVAIVWKPAPGTQAGTFFTEGGEKSESQKMAQTKGARTYRHCIYQKCAGYDCLLEELHHPVGQTNEPVLRPVNLDPVAHV